MRLSGLFIISFILPVLYPLTMVLRLRGAAKRGEGHEPVFKT
jgi:hypothetical protein